MTFSSAERFFQNRLELVAQFGRFFFGLVQLCQEFFGVAVIVGNNVRVFEIEIVVARLHFIDGDFPRNFIFLALVPPVDAGRDIFEADRLGH